MPMIKIRDICLGNKADIPSSFTQFAKDLIDACWKFDPKERPSLNKIYEDIERNEFKLLDLNDTEIKKVEMMAKKLKEKTPPYRFVF
ncbi:hypothetical protein M9Y10_024691 [Tritrichomonas musculus]|uniref:Serine-threonine/tyrosine-protein kinase catalytic domain-containing protein n=1 Tax=Tritrichomonas musculus TaxID=1915356 RepID=A0ABR2HC09_9EUKA